MLVRGGVIQAMQPFRFGGFLCGVFLFTLLSGTVTAALLPRSWEVEGVTREALVVTPTASADPHGSPKPLVFIFHGHGGTSRHAARSFSLHTAWPEAVCVYPQGLPTAGRLTDPEGRKAGWQARAGDYLDRDLKFFDIMLASLQREQAIDPRRIYVSGHSNGGAFTYLLAAKRWDVLAAIAPSAAIMTPSPDGIKPIPVLHIAGQSDALVRFAWQKRTIDALCRINKCEILQPLRLGLNQFLSKEGGHVFVFLHPGGHEFPKEAPAEIAAFFKKLQKKGF